MLLGYNLAMALGVILGMPFIVPVGMLSQKRRKTVLRRMGFTAIPSCAARYRRRPIWVHALSVGEVMAAIPLIQAFKGRFSDRPVVLSVSTFSGFELAGQRVDGIQKPVFFFPFDGWPCVRSVLKRVDPAIVLILETDLWPNFIFSLQKRKIPLVLVNARISRKSYARYRQFQSVTRMLFGALSGVCAPTVEDARRLTRLGVLESRIQVTGNLKYEHSAVLATPLEAGTLKQALGFDASQKILVAGSTHKGEEEKIFQAFLRIRESIPDAGIVLAPRDPQQAGAVCRMAESLSLNAFLLSEPDGKRPKSPVCLVVDRLGVLANLYAAADMVFVGGSLVREGGHNPLEPAARGKPILFGPDMSDFASIADALLKAGAAVCVPDSESLAAGMLRLMKDPKTVEAMGLAAHRVASEGRGAVEKILRVVAAHLTGENGVSEDDSGVKMTGVASKPTEGRS